MRTEGAQQNDADIVVIDNGSNDNSIRLINKNFTKINDPNNLEKVTRIFFNQRRKMLKKPFNQLFNGDQKVIEKLKINLDLRPQNLSLETYYNLACEYEKLRG